MGEEQLLELANQFLDTPKGLNILGEKIDIAGLKDELSNLSTKYNIDLSTLENTSIEDINLSLDSNLTREQRRQKRKEARKSARERLRERLDEIGETGIDEEQKIRAEIALLKDKIKSQVPQLQEYKITGRIQDANTNTPLKGVRVNLGVNADFIDPGNAPSNPLNVPEELIPQGTNIEYSDKIFVPIPGQDTRTDNQGRFEIKIKIPIIPENQKSVLDIGLLYSKTNFIPGTQAIINGDKTVKTSLSLTSLINLKEAAEDVSQDFKDKIDEANILVKSLSMTLFEKAISAKKTSIAKYTEVLRDKLLPLCVSLLVSFGIAKLTETNRKTCPTPEQLNSVIRKRNDVTRQLNQIFKLITINTALAVAFLSLANVLRGVRLSMDRIPAPQAWGTPPAKDYGGLIGSLKYSFTAKLQHINDELEKLEEHNKGLNRSILTSLVFLIAGITTAVFILKAIDDMTQKCIEENPDTEIDEETIAINQELLELAVEQEEDGNPLIKSVNGFEFSVVTDDKNPVGSLKRRFAIAKDARGIVVLKGEPSFSSSDQILIDELVFYIQQNNLKAI
jgi:hypothetical protein